MSETLIAALVAGITGVSAAFIGSWWNNRGKPDRRTTRTINLVDASGKLVLQLTDEIDRLNKEVQEARDEADGARAEARAASDEIARHTRRIAVLETTLREHGIDPSTINGVVR